MPHVEVEGRSVYYELFESPASDAPPLVLCTGLSGSCRGWEPLQVPEFSKTRSTLIFDHRGSGRSSDDGRPFSTADLAQDTVGLLDALDIGQVDLLGASMGGMAAQEVALASADRVRKLVLVGTWAKADGKRRTLFEGWAALARHGVPLGAMTRERLVWTLEDETFEQADLIDAMIEFFEKEESPTTADAFARQCDACVAHDTTDRLRSIPHPTLVICGRQDQLTPPKLHRQLSDGIPDAHCVTLNYGGHLVMAESAERFNQSVLQFLHD
jgi:pimeloyl-ACP methyl ester carboxylesterase